MSAGERVSEFLGLRLGPGTDPANGCSLPQDLLATVNAVEAPVVRWIAQRSQTPLLNAATRAINQLGNGWLYLFAAASMLAVRRVDALPIAILAISAVVVSYLIYFPMKRILARRRPYDWDPELVAAKKALDIYSCPSGHCMNVCAVGTVLCRSFPGLLPIALLALILVGWARLAMAHHYPSDLIAGILLGTLVGFTISSVL